MRGLSGVKPNVIRAAVLRRSAPLLLALMGVCGVAKAQLPGPVPSALDEALGRPAPTTPAPATGGLRADAPSRADQNAREIAQRFPAAQQAAMHKTLVQSLDIYQKLEAKFGWPKNDVAGSVAAYLVGNYMVMTGAAVPDEQFAAVAQQLRSSTRLRSVLSGQSPTALRDLYEQQAMVGTFMALAMQSHAQQPLPADRLNNLRETAKANLRLALNRDPELLTIGPTGMNLPEAR